MAFFAVLVIASIMFGLLLLTPARLDFSAASWIELQQENIDWVPILVIPAFAISLVSLTVAAIRLRRAEERSYRRLLIVLGLVVVVIGITLIGELPLNNRIEDWSALHPPSDWKDVRNEWETLHAIRGAAAGAALSLLYLVVPLPRAPRSAPRA